MAAPVWTLSVDLQAKTAVFTSGLADAAKKARGSFQDIKSSAQDMSQGSSRGFGDIRHSLGLLDNSIRGAHGAAMADAIRLTAQFVDVSGALPFAAMAGGFILVGGLIVEAVKKLQEYREQAEKLTETQDKFGTSINDVFNHLNEKILEAGIRSDELSKDHLAALHKQLELINMQSLSELVHSFDEVAKAADVAFGELKSNWYSFGIGSAGAQHALEQFKTKYDLLLSAGKDKEAADLLAGTRASAERVLAMQKQMKDSRQDSGSFDPNNQQKYNAYVAAENELKKAGVGITDKEVQAQEDLVRALDAQATVQTRVNELKGLQKGNARQSTANTMGAEAFGQLKSQMEADRKAQEEGEKLKEAAHQRAVTELEQSEKEKIEVTDKGSAERLAAISAAIKQEEMYGLQETSFYRELLNQRLTTAKEMATEEEKQKAEAAKEAADNDMKMAEIAFAASQEHQQLLNSAHRVSIQERIAQEVAAANTLYGIKMTGFSQEAAALDKSDKDYENKLRAIQDKQKQLTAQHENEITAIKDQAVKQRNKTILDAEDRMLQATAHDLTSVLMQHESFGSMMVSLGAQVVSGALQNALMLETVNGRKRFSSARTAAAQAYEDGLEYGGPIGPVIAPVLAAGAFAAVMAFNKGGIVPGVTRGDTVPAMLTPGESVLPKSLTEGLTNAARSGSLGGGPHYTVHVHNHGHTIQALDSDGVQGVLDKHADTLQKHFEGTVRRMHGR